MIGRAGAVLLFALIPISAAVLLAGYLIESQPPPLAEVSSRPIPTSAVDASPVLTPTHAPAPTPHPAARDAAAWATRDGRAFGAGGRGPNGVVLDSVTTFDGAVWTDLPTLPEPRVRAALVAMEDGRLLLFGGDGAAGATDTTFILEPEGNAWIVGPPMPDAWSVGAAQAIGERAYVFTDGEETDVLVYDVAAQAWTAAAPAPRPLSGAMPAVLDGQLYLMGGEDANGEASSDAFRYDPASDAWTTLPPMPVPAAGAPTAIVDGRIWVLSPGFDDARTVDALPVLDPSTGRWLSAEGRTGFSAAGVDVALPLDGGRILLLGAGGGGFSVTVLSTTTMELVEP